MMAPAPAPMPMPMGEVAPAPLPAVAAPRAADDMTGSVGFGVGVSAGTSLIVPDTTTVAMKYYLNDSLAILPTLSLQIGAVKDGDTSWALAPGALAMFNLLKGASTRFDAGVGLRFAAGKPRDPDTGAVATETLLNLSIPVALNVEHFFTRWFSMGLGASCHLVDFTKYGEAWTLEVDLNNVNYMGSLFFYTD
jgi:hypothetical protein